MTTMPEGEPPDTTTTTPNSKSDKKNDGSSRQQGLGDSTSPTDPNCKHTL